MSEKRFSGQFSGEKVLHTAMEHPLSFTLQHFHSITVWILAILLVCGAVWLFAGPIWAAMAGIAATAFYGWHLHHELKANCLVITSRRIIKYVHSGIGQNHTKEIRYESVKQMTATRRSLFDQIFKYGNLLINPGVDAIEIRGIRLHSEVEAYLARIVDYLKNNPATDELTPFKSRKERYAKEIGTKEAGGTL